MKNLYVTVMLCLMFSGSVWAEKPSKGKVKSPGFAALDKNKDGLLSTTEAKNWKYLPIVFPHVDANQDGKLDKIEFSALEENISK